MDELYLVKKGNASFYAPASQIEMWEQAGFEIYQLTLTPMNEAAVNAVEEGTDSESGQNQVEAVVGEEQENTL